MTRGEGILAVHNRMYVRTRKHTDNKRRPYPTPPSNLGASQPARWDKDSWLAVTLEIGKHQKAAKRTEWNEAGSERRERKWKIEKRVVAD